MKFGFCECQCIRGVLLPGALRELPEPRADGVSILFYKVYVLFTNSSDDSKVRFFDHPIQPLTPVRSNNGVLTDGHPPILVDDGTCDGSYFRLWHERGPGGW